MEKIVMFRTNFILAVRNFTLAVAVALICSLPSVANADPVEPGFDLFVTGDGAGENFSGMPIPAGFFMPGSDPFGGQIDLEGLPLDTFNGQNVGDTDTIVERLGTANLSGVGDTASIEIELVALSLKSIAPIEVTFGTSSSMLWDVFVDLSPNSPSVGQMTITQTSATGGTYTASLWVQPVFTFVSVDDPNEVRVLDTGILGVPPRLVETSNPVNWEYVPTHDQLVVPDITGPNFYIYGDVEHTGPHPEVFSTKNPVPEPSTLVLLGTSLIGMVFWRRKKS